MENIYPDIVRSKTDEELVAMAYTERQWESEILVEAWAELEKRGLMVNEIAERKEDLIQKEQVQLSAGRQSDMPGRIFGWLGIFGLLGIIIGYHHTYGKVYSKYTGKEYFKYNEESRENGRYTFYIAVILHTLFLLNKLMIFLRYYL